MDTLHSAGTSISALVVRQVPGSYRFVPEYHTCVLNLWDVSGSPFL
jgi:hypothetical protein